MVQTVILAEPSPARLPDSPYIVEMSLNGPDDVIYMSNLRPSDREREKDRE